MPTNLKNTLHQAFNRINSLHTRQEKTGEKSTGYKSIDTALGGAHTFDLIVFTGFPNNYKTTLALQILIHNILVENRSALYVSPNAHHHGSLPQQLKVVWCLLL